MIIQPVGVLYRPSESKLKNVKSKDYLGKAVSSSLLTYIKDDPNSSQKLIAASDTIDAYTTFTGVTRLQQGISPSGVFIERPTINTGESPMVGLTRSATSPPAIGKEPEAILLLLCPHACLDRWGRCPSTSFDDFSFSLFCIATEFANNCL